MWMIVSVLLACILIPVGIFLYWSYPGKPKSFVDKTGRPLPGSISEKIYVKINGVKQGMILQSKDQRKPVLLFLHGGMPEFFLTQHYPTGLEDIFTVCWWEQRGAGISYDANTLRETMTVEQMIGDTLEVTNYLRQRFGKEKIFLMAHSGGTFFGIQAAARVPALYYAYIGVSQMVYQLQSEKLAYDYMLQQFKSNGNTKMIRKLEAAPVTMTNGTPDAYRALRDEAMHSLGIGTTHDMKSVIKEIFLASLQSREYTLMEKIRTWRAKANAGVALLWREMLPADLSKTVTEFAVPIYFFHGVYDYTCSYPLAKSYFEKIKAPVKGFYTFERSAHSTIFEEPEKAQKILREDVLVGWNNLADRQVEKQS